MRNQDGNQEKLDVFTQKLICRVETEGLITAPAHMKQEILERSRRMDVQLVVQSRRLSKKMQLFFYSLKVGAAVAMALFMLFLVPKELPRAELDTAAAWVSEQQTEIPLGKRLNAGLGKIDRMFTRLISLEQNR